MPEPTPKTRVYFWINRVEVDRPGGPWWYRDFPDPQLTPEQFLDVMEPCLKAYAIDPHPEVGLSPARIRPPKSVPITWLR